MTPRCIESSTLIQNLHLPHLHLPHLHLPHLHLPQLQRPCGRVGGRRGSAALERVAGRGVWCGLLVLVLAGMAGLGAPAAGQGTPAGSAAPTFPTPLVSAGFGKQPAITWPDYQVWEQCYVHSNHGIDRPESDSMFQPPRACLQRLGLDTISPGLYWKVRLFAIRVGADSVLRSLVARQLSAMPVGANIPRAELLDSVVNDFVSVPGGVPAARAYLAQIDALGPTAWRYRIDARETIVHATAPDTEPDAYVTLYREETNIIHDPKVESLPEMQKEVGRSGMTRLARAQGIIEADLHRWNAIKTQSRDSIAHLTDLPRWFNGPAPAVHCDYYFPTPEAAAPLDGPPPAVPIAGRLSLLVFVGSSVDGAALRQLHQTLPALPIVLVDGITGAVGLTIVEDPARAAVLMHQALTAQGVPGALCLAKRQLKTTPSGHVLVLADPNTVMYHDERGSQNAYLVDPTGVVVGIERERDDGFPGGGWSDFVWYLKRIAAKYAATTPSR